MLRPDRSIERVYLHRAPVDMRNYAESTVMQWDRKAGPQALVRSATRVWRPAPHFA